MFFCAANEKKAIEAMFDREQKQEKNLEIRERDLKRAKALEVDAQKREVCNSNVFSFLYEVSSSRYATYITCFRARIKRTPRMRRWKRFCAK